ncbi:MAG: 30S ribosomal protein S8e [Nitrososphaerales archaeon]
MGKAIENLKKRKITGGKKRAMRTRRAFEKNSYPTETMVGEAQNVIRLVRGGSTKIGARRALFVNVADPASKKVTKVKIQSVSANSANRDYNRRGIITKGALLQTELGSVRVTSRPGRDGEVNGLLQK